MTKAVVCPLSSIPNNNTTHVNLHTWSFLLSLPSHTPDPNLLCAWPPDISLLPDSYAAMVYAYITQGPPQPEVAAGLVQAMAGAGQDPTPAWATLVSQCTVAGLHEEAVAQAQAGMRELGLVPTEAVAQAYIVSLCALGQPGAAADFFRGGMGGFNPGVITPRYFNPLVAAYAAAGDAGMAQTWIDEAGSQGWQRNAATYNGLLEGLVGHMTGGLDDDYTAR